MNNLSCRVLLIDESESDYLAVRDLLAGIVTPQIDLEWVNNYQVARQSLAHHQYDVCLLAYGLGGATELELVREFAGGEIPFILLTENEDHEIDVAAAKAGAADYLVKRHINAPLLERSLRYAIERKKTEAALLHAQRFAQATVDALPGYIAVLDSRGTIIAVNAGWREFAASNGFIGADSGIGTNYLEVCDQSDEADGRAAAACIRAVSAGEEPISAVEYPCDSPTARQWFRVSATRFPGEGPLHVVVAHENITERKLAAQQFEVHSHLLNVIGQAVVVTDSVGKITYWNAFAAKLYGWSAAEVLGRNILEVTPPDTTQKQAMEILACLSRGESWSGEFLVQKRDGTKFPAYVTDTPVLDQAGDVVSIIGTSLDITERKSAEETATLLAAVVESSEDAIISKTLDGIITSWNAGAENLYGYTAPEAIGRSVSFLAPSELSNEMQELLKKIEHGEQIKQYETVRVRKDGSRVDISLSISPLKNAESVLIGASSIKRDITERKQAEATLRDSNERFLQLANNIGDVFWVRSPDMSELRYISPAFEHIWGRSLESLYANPQQWSEFVVPEDREYALGIFSKLQRDARSVSCEHRIMRPDGEIRWIYTRGFQVRNDAGELMCLTGVASDITERKRVEERLLRSEANLIKAQQMAHLGSWELDLGNSEDFNANSLRWSDELFRIFGYKPGEVEVSNDIFFQAVHPDDRETVSRTMQESLQSGNPYSIQHRIILPDGRERIVQSRGEILTNEETGQPVKVIGLGQDITESKQAENSLFESRQRLILATESAHVGIWDWDVVENKMVWDAQMFALYGIREQDVGSAYDAWKNGLHPEDRERAEADLHAALEGSRDFDTQFRVVSATGEVRHIEAHAMVQRAENGTALRMIGVNWDVTERQRAEESLRESEERFSGAFEYAPIGIALVSPEGQWLKVNHALCNLLGYSQQELLVRTFQDITHPDDLEADLENVHRLLAGEVHSYQMEKRYFHSRGDLVSVSLSVSLESVFIRICVFCSGRVVVRLEWV